MAWFNNPLGCEWRRCGVDTTEIVICIDFEPDQRRINRAERAEWHGAVDLFALLGEHRARLEDATRRPVRFNWFVRMDPQIADTYGDAAWAVERFRKQIEEAQAHGDRFGVHVHFYRWDGDDWLIDHASQAWIDHCLAVGFESYRRAFSQPCEIVRTGDHFMNQATLATIERLGARFDLSLEPGTPGLPHGLFQTERNQGMIPSQGSVPRIAYRPSLTDWTRADRSRNTGLVFVPISTCLPGDGEPPWTREGLRTLFTKRSANTLSTGQYLRPREHPHLNMGLNPPFLRERFERVRRRLPYLALLTHTSFLTRPGQRFAMESALQFLATHPQAKTFEMVAVPPRAAHALR